MSDEKEKKSFWAYVWARVTKAQAFGQLPENQTHTNEIKSEARQSEDALVKFVIAMNGGGVIASLALVGQIANRLDKQALVAVADSVGLFLIALTIIGFGLALRMLSLWAVLGRFFWPYVLLRGGYFGIFILSFYLFVQGTSGVLDALVAAY